MTYDPNEIADVLDKAHDVLLDRGWCQGALDNPAGRVCTVGAIYTATAGNAHVATTFGLVALYAVECEVGRMVVGWNDDPERTEDEVFDVLRNTAKKLRESAS